MANTYSFGKASKLFYGDEGATTFTTQVTGVRNKKIDVNTDSIDVTTDDTAAGGNKASVPGLSDWAISFEIISDESNTSFTALRTASIAKTIMAFHLSPTGSATTGYRGDFYISKWSEDMASDGVQVISVELTLSYDGTRNAGWVTGA